MTKEVSHADARDGDWTLERHEQTSTGSLVWFELSDVFAVEQNLTRGDLVVWVAHDHQAERAFAAAVWPHQSVSFPTVHFKIDSTENRLLVDRNVEVNNF